MWVWSLNKSAVSLINESIHFNHYFINKLRKGKHPHTTWGSLKVYPGRIRLNVCFRFFTVLPIPSLLIVDQTIWIGSVTFIYTRVRAVEAEITCPSLNSAIEQKGLILSHEVIQILHFQSLEDLTLLGKSLPFWVFLALDTSRCGSGYEYCEARPSVNFVS